jgi:phytoene dehydrogenase-like protein
VDYDVVIIGAGMSGLAAGIRLAYFGKRVCILERHYAFGGLNSYYKLGGYEFDVGLHAVTNYVPPGRRGGPLNKLLRQLRLTRDDLDLREQRHSEVRFPGRTLRFSNDFDLLTSEVAREFPGEVDGFRRLAERIKGYDDARLDAPYVATRPVLRDHLRDPVLTDMLLCPLMFYGSAEEHDMDFTQFVTLFKSIFFEGFARPRDGVRRIVKTLVRKFREHGGRIRTRCGVATIRHDGVRASGVILDSGEAITAGVVLSSAGLVETMQLTRGDGAEAQSRPDGGSGQLSFVESIAVLDQRPAQWGHEATIVFYNDRESFTYARPGEPVDLRSGIVCCPNNYADHDRGDGVFRLTWLADYQPWMTWGDADYAAAKSQYGERFFEAGERFLPGFAQHVRFVDMFTPRTIRYYTGHVNGAVYGSPRKQRDGKTPLENLFICGTDQGYLGIVGAMLSGITIANLHVLGQDERMRSPG